MSDRSTRISNLLTSLASRTSYISSKLGVLVPSQIRSLRLKSNMPRQADLAREAKMHQSRISMFETPGAANLTLETLSRLAAAFKVGLVVKFVPFSEMLRWENGYSQDTFDVTRIDEDNEFLKPEKVAGVTNRAECSAAYSTNVLASTVTVREMAAESKPPSPTKAAGGESHRQVAAGGLDIGRQEQAA